MKFLAVFILSLSLLVSSSFAVSLTPPLVLKMQEDRSMATDIDTTTNESFSFLDAFILGMSIPLFISGLAFVMVGHAQKGNDDYNQSDAKLSIGVGTGMTVLGAGGLIYIIYF